MWVVGVGVYLRRHVFSRSPPISEKELFLEEHIGFRRTFIRHVAAVTAVLITGTRRNSDLRYRE